MPPPCPPSSASLQGKSSCRDYAVPCYKPTAAATSTSRSTPSTSSGWRLSRCYISLHGQPSHSQASRHNLVGKLQPEVSSDNTDKSSALLVNQIFDFQPQLPANISADYDVYDSQLVSLTGILADRSIHSSLVAGNPIGIIGIDLVMRDRFRINGLLVQGWSTESQSMMMQVTKSYNFCPKYGQSRAMLKTLHPR